MESAFVGMSLIRDYPYICAPRLSAAIIIPSLYLIARTDVPVTMGCLEICVMVAFSNRFMAPCCLLCSLDTSLESIVLGPLGDRIGAVRIDGVISL